MLLAESKPIKIIKIIQITKYNIQAASHFACVCHVMLCPQYTFFQIKSTSWLTFLYNMDSTTWNVNDIHSKNVF